MSLHLRISKCLTQLRPSPQPEAWGGGPPNKVTAAAAVEGRQAALGEPFF